MDIGGDQNQLLLRLMSAASLRGRVIANNIANQNVPGFQARVVRFEELLAPALEEGRGAKALDEVEPRVEAARSAATSPDGNTVDLEGEMAAMRENRLLYELYATILQGRMDMIRASIVESR